MHMTKHVFGVYSTAPPPQGRSARPTQAVQATVDAAPPTRSSTTHTGPATVAAYTVAHGRDGEPEWGLVIGDVADGPRAYGRVEDPDLLRRSRPRSGSAGPRYLEAGGRGVNLVPRWVTTPATAGQVTGAATAARVVDRAPTQVRGASRRHRTVPAPNLPASSGSGHQPSELDG